MLAWRYTLGKGRVFGRRGSKVKGVNVAELMGQRQEPWKQGTKGKGTAGTFRLSDCPGEKGAEPATYRGDVGTQVPRERCLGELWTPLGRRTLLIWPETRLRSACSGAGQGHGNLQPPGRAISRSRKTPVRVLVMGIKSPTGRRNMCVVLFGTP